MRIMILKQALLFAVPHFTRSEYCFDYLIKVNFSYPGNDIGMMEIYLLQTHNYPMLAALYDYMKSIYPIDAEITDALDNCFDIIEVPKRHILLKEGDTCQYLYLVLDGLVRIYHLEEDEEVSSIFVEEKYLFNSPRSFYLQKPGYEYMETLEPTTLARIHYDDLQGLYQKYAELNFIARVITENYFVKSEERLYLLRKKTAEERYRYFIDRYPSLLQRVPLKYIASYLGITLETLSRIRNKIRK